MTVRSKIYTDIIAALVEDCMLKTDCREKSIGCFPEKEKSVRNKIMWIRNLMMAAILMLAPGWAAAEITVEGAWVRMPPPVADTAAGYLTLNNSGDVGVNITAIESDAAGKPEFHSMSMHDGMMHMNRMGKVIVPAHGKLEFSPGGDHLMLKDLKRELKAGEYIILKFHTSDGYSVDVHAEVRDMRKMQDSHGEHRH
jgi:copper(I)-binding protein